MSGNGYSLHTTGRERAARVGRAPTSGARLRWSGLLAVVLVDLAAGCSRGPEFVEVEGVVTLAGKPLPEVEVVFLPNSEKGNTGPRAAAYTDPRGHYKLHCDQAHRDGTVVGPTRVCIIDITAVASLATMPGMRMPGELALPEAKAEKGKVSRVPADYQSPTRTPLHVEVEPGQQTLNFDIKSGRRP